jgi:hypothetical protein
MRISGGLLTILTLMACHKPPASDLTLTEQGGQKGRKATRMLGPDVARGNLVFLGTIVSAKPHTASGALQHSWAITARVDEVVFGKFDRSTFSFLVHSPAKSGLNVGDQYRIVAKQTADGYVVDEYQWRVLR